LASARKKDAVIENRDKFQGAVFFEPDGWKIIGYNSTKNLILLGRYADEYIVGFTAEENPTDAINYVAMDLFELITFSQGDITFTDTFKKEANLD
jgi:hypothetical protein